MLSRFLNIPKSKPIFKDCTVSQVNELLIVPGIPATVGLESPISQLPPLVLTVCNKYMG